MPFTNNPKDNAKDRIRLMIGDTDECDEGISDEVIQYLLDTQPNEKLAAMEALKFLVSKYANYVTEKAGGLFVKGSDKYKQYKELLDKVMKDPSFSILSAGKPFAGGISKADITTNAMNPDANLNPIRAGQFSIDTPTYDDYIGFRRL